MSRPVVATFSGWCGECGERIVADLDAIVRGADDRWVHFDCDEQTAGRPKNVTVPRCPLCSDVWHDNPDGRCENCGAIVPVMAR